VANYPLFGSTHAETDVTKKKLYCGRINSRGDRRYKKEAVLWLLGITPEDAAEAMA